MTIHEEIIERIASFRERGARPAQMFVVLGATAKREFFAGLGKVYEPVPGWAYHKPLGADGWIGQIENVAMYYDVDCPSWHVQWISADAMERMRLQRETQKRIDECMATFKEEIGASPSVHRERVTGWNLDHVKTIAPVRLSDLDEGDRLRLRDECTKSLVEKIGADFDKTYGETIERMATEIESLKQQLAHRTRLRELQAEARRKERHQVLVDNSWWDD